MAASNGTCFAGCHNQNPKLTSNPDFTGAGVLIGFMGTAYLTVAILILYYIFAYQPESNYFDAKNSSLSQTDDFKPNPVDVLILRGLHLCKPAIHAVLRIFRRGKPLKPFDHERLEKSLSDCIILMADIQIISGLAILISGWIAMQCDLSAFHWEMVVYLAWFSCLTHLAVLTFLRRRLYCWRPMRAWRLFAMAFLVILLMVALVPTAVIDWPSPEDFDQNSGIYNIDTDKAGSNFAPNRYALCAFKEMGNIGTNSLFSTIVSMVVILFGFITRVVKLYRPLSNTLWRLRSRVSEKCSRILGRLHSFTHDQLKPSRTARGRWKRAGKSLVQSLVYQPMCATFIVARAMLDVYSSSFYEILWLVYAMIWGTERLLWTRSYGHDINVLGSDQENWRTFGQIVPVVLLVAPVVGILEYFFPEDSKSDTVSAADNGEHTQNIPLLHVRTNVGLAKPPQTNDPSILPSGAPSCDRASYEKTAWYKCLLVLIVVPTIEFASWVYWWNRYAVAKVDWSKGLQVEPGTFVIFVYLLMWTVLLVPLSILYFALVSVALQSAYPHMGKWTARRVSGLAMLFMVGFTVATSLESLDLINYETKKGHGKTFITEAGIGGMFLAVFFLLTLYVLVSLGTAFSYLFRGRQRYAVLGLL